MATLHNSGDVRNQVGGSQTVQGSIYTGDSYYSHHYTAAPGPETEEERLKLIHNDILSSLAFPKMLDRRSEVAPPHRDTCRWILSLQDYIDWVSSPCGLLWIKGKPGAGKSTLMSFLYDQLQSRPHQEGNIRLDFFFSARGSEMQRSTLGMLRSLLNQLFRQDDSIRPMIVEQYNEKSKAFGRVMGDARGWDWQRRELETLLSSAIISSSRHRRIDIFIDALDEAGEVAAREVAQYFHTINDQAAETFRDPLPCAVSICISCRHYPIASSVSGIEIWVERHNGRDIQCFIHDRLNINVRLTDNDDDETREWVDLEMAVVRKSQNIFQWARLVVPLLEKCLDDAEPLEHARQMLDRLPKELEDVYVYIARTVINPHSRSQSYRLFQWVCLAERPLSVVELCYALELDGTVSHLSLTKSQHDSPSILKKSPKHIQTRLKALSGGLVEVVDHPERNNEYTRVIDHSERNDELVRYNRWRGHVQIIHQSVNDFLTSKGLALLDSLQHSDVGANLANTVVDSESVSLACQAALYRSCLDYLVSNLAEMEAVINSANSPRSDVCAWADIEEEDNDWQFLERFPLAHYVCLNVLEHAHKAGNNRGIPLDVEMQLVTQALPTWSLLSELFSDVAPSVVDDQIFPHPKSTVLHAAAFADLPDMLEKAVEGEDDLDRRTQFGYTALHFASLKGHQRVADFLMSKGASVDATTSAGQTAFVLAAANDRAALVALLLRKEAEINPVSDKLYDALVVACRHGSSAVVEMLLKAGADVKRDRGPHISAIYATVDSSRGTSKVVRMLIEAGIDVNIKRPGYVSIVERARSRYDNEGPEMVRLLLQAGAR